MTEITMDSDAGHALLWLALRATPMHYTEIAARIWPDIRDLRDRAARGIDTVLVLRAVYLRREAWATMAVNKLILAGLAEVDPDAGDSWARVTIAGADLARAWGVKP